MSHSREVYNLLDLMGDLGGIIEVLIFGCSFFVTPISEHSFILKALKKLFLAKTVHKELFS